MWNLWKGLGTIKSSHCHHRKLVSIHASLLAPLDPQWFLGVCVTNLLISGKVCFEHKVLSLLSPFFGFWLTWSEKTTHFCSSGKLKCNRVARISIFLITVWYGIFLFIKCLPNSRIFSAKQVALSCLLPPIFLWYCLVLIEIYRVVGKMWPTLLFPVLIKHLFTWLKPV